MEEEDDDFYDPTDTVPPAQAPNNAQNPPSRPQGSGDAEEEVEVEDDEVCSRRAESLKEFELIAQFFRMILISLRKHRQMLLHQRCE